MSRLLDLEPPPNHLLFLGKEQSVRTEGPFRSLRDEGTAAMKSYLLASFPGCESLLGGEQSRSAPKACTTSCDLQSQPLQGEQCKGIKWMNALPGPEPRHRLMLKILFLHEQQMDGRGVGGGGGGSSPRSHCLARYLRAWSSGCVARSCSLPCVCFAQLVHRAHSCRQGTSSSSSHRWSCSAEHAQRGRDSQRPSAD